MTDIAANKQIALRFLKSLETGPEYHLLADDVKWWVQGQGYINLDEFRELLARIRKTKSPSHMTINHVTAEEDRVAIECDGKATMSDGRLYENTYNFLYFVRDGKIVEIREHFDTAYSRDIRSSASKDLAAN